MVAQMTESTLVHAHQPCPLCSSSDAFSIYDDGHGYCFSCKGTTPGYSIQPAAEAFTYQYVPWRGVTAETMRFFKASTKVNQDGEPVAIGFPYQGDAVKIRELSNKTFYTKGGMKD